jgi:hypothetical protein
LADTDFQSDFVSSYINELPGSLWKLDCGNWALDPEPFCLTQTVAFLTALLLKEFAKENNHFYWRPHFVRLCRKNKVMQLSLNYFK